MSDELVFLMNSDCRLPRWGPGRSVCPVRWSRCSLSLFPASWRVSLVSPSDLCPVEICSQPAWQVGQGLIFLLIKMAKSARENNVLGFVFWWTCYTCAELSASRSFSPSFFQTGASSWHSVVGVMAVWGMVTSTMLHRYLSHSSLGRIWYWTYKKTTGDFLKLHNICCPV